MKKIILDTDMANQVDDQFALVYLLKSLNNIELKAITIAPFSKLKTIEEGTELSYNTTLKILELMDKNEYKDKVFKGATEYLKNDNKSNLAVNKIIEVCLKNDETTIIAIGALTNLALAIKQEPKIIDRIKIIWLGGNDLSFNENMGTNFKDIDAVKVVFESGVDLTVIPCKNVASNLITTIYELKHGMEENVVNNFLIEQLIKCNKDIQNIGTSKILWDLSAIAFIINENWFTCKLISCPKILNDSSYEIIESNREITFVNTLNRDRIFEDFFRKVNL